jgi:hypothetical protein
MPWLLIEQEKKECGKDQLKPYGDQDAGGAHSPNQRVAFDRSE